MWSPYKGRSIRIDPSAMTARVFFSILLAGTSGLLAAQNGPRTNTPFDKAHFADAEGLKAALAAIRKGDGLFRHGGRDTDAALLAFEQAYAFNRDNADLNLKIGLCHLNGRQHHLSLPYFQAALALDNTIPRIHFLLGAAYQLNARWDEAIAEYREHVTASGGFPDVEPLYNTAERRMIQCKNGRSLQSASLTGQVTNLGDAINSTVADYGVLTSLEGDRLSYTSRRSLTADTRINKNTGDPFEDIFVVERTEMGWGTPRPIGTPVNSELNDASVGLFPDGRTLLIYRDAKGPGDLYTSTLSGNTWSTPVPLPDAINSPANETSAWPGPDGKTMYFVSDREGGVGGQDIWISQWDANAGTWGPPRNPGPSINSIEDEDGVFMSADGRTIYFSSKGHTSMGGYDVFRSTLTDGKWSVPENLGWPVNGPDDDLFFVLAADGRTGWYSSVRPGGFGEDDIYRVDLSVAPSREETASMGASGLAEGAGSSMITLKGRVTDERTGTGLEAIVEVIDPSNGRSVASTHSDPRSGQYLVVVPAGKNLWVCAYDTGYLPGNTSNGDIALAPMEKGTTTALQGIRFEAESGALHPASAGELGRLISLMRANPELRIQLGAYAENASSNPMRASERRAQALAGHLLQNGIAMERVAATGLGAAPDPDLVDAVPITVQ